MQKKLTRSRGIRREATAAPPLAVAHVCAAAPPWAASSPARSQPVSAPSLPRGRPARRGVQPELLPCHPPSSLTPTAGLVGAARPCEPPLGRRVLADRGVRKLHASLLAAKIAARCSGVRSSEGRRELGESDPAKRRERKREKGMEKEKEKG